MRIHPPTAFYNRNSAVYLIVGICLNLHGNSVCEENEIEQNGLCHDTASRLFSYAEQSFFDISMKHSSFSGTLVYYCFFDLLGI